MGDQRYFGKASGRTLDAFKEQFAGGVDVVLDYLWGQSAECLLTAGSKAGTGAPISFIQIGTAGGTITLPGAILRSTPIELIGSGLGSVPINRIVGAIEQVLRAAVAGRFEILRYQKSNRLGQAMAICPVSSSQSASRSRSQKALRRSLD